MSSIMDAVNAIGEWTHVPPAKVKSIARKLIDDGVLPKSKGKRIAEISTPEFVKLLFACVASDTVADATQCAETYFSLPANEQWGMRPIAESVGDHASQLGSFIVRVINDINDEILVVNSMYGEEIQISINEKVVSINGLHYDRNGESLGDVYYNLPGEHRPGEFMIGKSRVVVHMSVFQLAEMVSGLSFREDAPPPRADGRARIALSAKRRVRLTLKAKESA
ncbi:hypothetical protein E6C67_26640 [Azospirillum sp. TSA2s]|uniref:hypothetical protein n=1 Tax=Azospirillum sp. TSA2s TaxID=709810 RepID=UPI0010AA6DAD|nr:hypothetical protein [Azospirillum sp. TSA2s]QCG97354.1 hypothetical protein E6C67_26640 [Azospirillum sp. TSA2s]